MDASLESHIRVEVQNALADSQNTLMTEMKNLITREMGKIQTQNQKLAESQLNKIEETLSDSHKSKKKGNEEQFKHNNKVILKLQEADKTLCEEVVTEQSILNCRERIAEGMTIVKHRQKLIKLADTHEAGWRVVQEYESNPLADDSDDEKRIQKALYRAERKIKTEKAKRKDALRRYHPYPPFGKDSGNRTDAGSIKPGRCFGCGEKGHWKKECPKELRGNDKISTFDSLFSVHLYEKQSDIDSQVCSKSSSVSSVPCSVDSKIGHSGVNQVNTVTPVGRLHAHISQWKHIGSNDYILGVIEKGYKLPLKTIPCRVFLQNNRSALSNPSFVSDEINKLLMKGCISEVSEQPCVVNPLTVAQNKAGKLRLVLDCRHVNPHLFQFRFKYENSEVAKVIFDKGDKMFTFDLKSAYHHIMINDEFCDYLGFHWSGKFYVFNVLPFGLATAGFIFRKVTREVVKFWRSSGYKVIMYLDDGLGGAESHEKAVSLKLYLPKLGFLLADEKCERDPTHTVTWLGLVWDMKFGFLRLTQERVQKLISYMDSLLAHLRTKSRAVDVKFLASVVGQLISAQSVFGQAVRTRTRSMYECINDRLGWKSLVYVTQDAEKEIRFWLENADAMNVKGKSFCQLTEAD